MPGPVTRRQRPGISRRALSLLVGLIVAATSLSIAGPAAAKGSTGPGQPAGDGARTGDQSQWLSGLPPRPPIYAGTGISGLTCSHAASVRSVGYTTANRRG